VAGRKPSLTKCYSAQINSPTPTEVNSPTYVV